MKEFQTVSYSITTKKMQPGSLFTAAFLSDLHNREYGPENERLLEAIRLQKPDVILLSGDMLTADAGVSFLPAQRLILALQELAPVYYSLGNHELGLRERRDLFGSAYEEYTEPLRRAGVQILENCGVPYESSAGRIRIYGYDLPMEYYRIGRQPPLPAEELTRALGTLDAGVYHILLAHNPVYFDSYAAWGADLTLSGHLHGGIIRIPPLGGVITPQARLLPKYDKGYFEKDGKKLIVSPGLGTHTVNVRILNPAELIMIKLEGEQ